MKLDEVDDIKSVQYPRRINLAVTQKMFDDIAKLKPEFKKSPTDFLRKAIDKALKEAFDIAG